jgi:hypothetical protein
MCFELQSFNNKGIIMSKLIKFTIPPQKSVAAIGGIVVGANDVANQFVARFGTSWRLVPGAKSTYVLFDKIDDCNVFMLQNGVITHYPGVTKTQFIEMWEKGNGFLFQGWHYPVESSVKYTGLQVMKILNSSHGHLNKKVS